MQSAVDAKNRAQSAGSAKLNVRGIKCLQSMETIPAPSQ